MAPSDKPPVNLKQLVDRNWVTIKQLAIICEVKYRTARKWVADKKIEAVLVGGEYRIYEEELNRFLTHGNRSPPQGVEAQDGGG